MSTTEIRPTPCAGDRPVLRTALLLLLVATLLLALGLFGGPVTGVSASAANTPGAAFDALVAHGQALAGTVPGDPSRMPETVINPFPANGATGVPTNVTLSWSNGGSATGYRIRFGTMSNPPQVVALQTELTYSPETLYSPSVLQYSTTYYWRVDAVDGSGTDAIGPLWSFKTAAPTVTEISEVDASDGTFSDRIRVSWNAVTSATAYMVSRSLFPLGEKIAISPWQADVSFDDLDVLPAQTYYYWIQWSLDGGNTVEGDYSPYDPGYRNPSTYSTYSVTYKNCDIDLDGSGRLLVAAPTGTRSAATIKIRPVKGSLMPPITEGPTTQTQPTFYVRASVHPGAEITGSIARFSTAVPMKSLVVHGDIGSLTGYAEHVSAEGLGRVAVSYVQDASQTATPDGPYCFIEQPTSSTTGLKASVSTAGVNLAKFSLPYEDVTSIKVMAKKGRGPALKRFVSGGNTGIAVDQGNEAFEVRSLQSLSVQSGSVRSQTVQTSAGRLPTSISARGFVFTASSTTGTLSVQIHRGDVSAAHIVNVSPLLNVSARGGDVSSPLIETSGAIGILQASLGILRQGGGIILYGGTMGASTTQVVSGEDTTYHVPASIGSIFGAAGVNGAFYAGTSPWSGTPVPNYAGNIGSIKTGPVVVGMTVAPEIKGLATVQDGTALRMSLALQGNAMAFTVYDLLVPKP